MMISIHPPVGWSFLGILPELVHHGEVSITLGMELTTVLGCLSVEGSIPLTIVQLLAETSETVS